MLNWFDRHYRVLQLGLIAVYAATITFIFWGLSREDVFKANRDLLEECLPFAIFIMICQIMMYRNYRHER